MRRWPRRLALVLVTLVAVLGFGDRGVKGFAERTIETSVRSEITGVGTVDASISSFPFVGRLLLGGSVSHVELVLHDVVGHRIPVEEVRLDIEDLRIDRNDLLNGDQVEITGSGPVRVRLRITRANVETLLGPLTGVAFAVADGTRLSVDDGRVQLGAGISFPVPSADLLPCAASAVIENSEVVIDCVADTMPQVVIDAVGSASLRSGQR